MYKFTHKFILPCSVEVWVQIFSTLIKICDQKCLKITGLVISYNDVILASRILCCGSNRQIHRDHRKRDCTAALLSQREGHPTPQTGFYCFSRHITSRMVLIYYAQVCFGWLPFTENKGEDVANYIKEEGYLQM